MTSFDHTAASILGGTQYIMPEGNLSRVVGAISAAACTAFTAKRI